VSNTGRYGGGINGGTFYNCTLVDNTGTIQSGGAQGGTFRNSIVYGNFSPTYTNYSFPGGLSYSCSSPDPGFVGNITNEPGFVDAFGGDYRLVWNSPCVNAGTNAYAPMPYDLEGNDRIHFDTVDMGCYEFIPEPGLMWIAVFIIYCKRFVR
ncbi:MAG: hypothetical protein GY869_14335, partial [Planctomycetes bacterium]|nr:hypothetical protein [Planctomycetota bacterium]